MFMMVLKQPRKWQSLNIADSKLCSLMSIGFA
jgi:hypothetical protein